MTKEDLDKLVSEICKREGKKKEVIAGNVREVLSHLADILYEVPDLGAKLYAWGVKRAEDK